MAANTVSVQEEDFLDQDPALRGQNYVCLSFLSPEEIIKKKETYFFQVFLKSFSDDMNEFFAKFSEEYKEKADLIATIKERYRYIFDTEKITDEYQFFLNKNGENLEKEYHAENDFQTSIRGIKVRGVFDTLKEAELRAQVLKRMDGKFHVYVAQVGCWCPWSPNPEDIVDQVYAETHLNTLMKNYKENQEKKDIFFEERKRDLQFAKTKEVLETDDTWTQKQNENEVVATEVVEAVGETEVVAAEVVKTETVVESVVEESVSEIQPIESEVPVEEPKPQDDDTVPEVIQPEDV